MARATGRKRPKKRRKKKKRARGPFRLFLLGFFVVLIAATGVGAALAYRDFAGALPPVSKLVDYRPPAVSRVLSRRGKVIAEFFIEKRYPLPIYKIPRKVQLAFIAAEDAQFYDHRGVDLFSIARAALSNYRAGQTRQGGSTITQQVVKQLLLTPERSYERKIKELVLALRLEQELTKSEILELYLNQIYLGSGAYGVQAASREYFGKEVEQITLAEAALLAGLPQAPSRYSPIRDFDKAKARQRYVIRRMLDEGFITPRMAHEAEAEEIEIGGAPEEAGPAPYFVEHVRRSLVSRFGSDATYQLGLDIHTTVDLRMQRLAEKAIADGIKKVDERQGFRGALRRLGSAELRRLLGRSRSSKPLPSPGTELEAVVSGRSGFRKDGGLDVIWAGGQTVIPASGMSWARKGRYKPAQGDVLEVVVTVEKKKRTLALTKNNDTQGSLVAMHPKTGDVLAMVGGRDYTRSQFNRATQAMRQPGSSFKPLVFAAAMDRGFTPASVIDDAPVTYRTGPGQRWSPKNFTKKYYGPTRLRTALTHSRNVVAVKLLDRIGLDYLRSYLPRFGFERTFPKNLSIALGSAEVTLMEMIEAYGVFANLGEKSEPRFVRKIVDIEGNLVEETPVRRRRTMSRETAYVIVSLMQNVMKHGTGRRSNLDRPVAGKTGTTNDLRDAWFMGYTPDLLTGVWVGYDQDKTLGRRETGGRAAAPIWKEFMSGALAHAPVTDFPVPDDIVLVNVDVATGLRARPGGGRSVLEAFKRGTEPKVFAPRRGQELEVRERSRFRGGRGYKKPSAPRRRWPWESF